MLSVMDTEGNAINPEFRDILSDEAFQKTSIDLKTLNRDFFTTFIYFYLLEITNGVTDFGTLNKTDSKIR